MEFTGAIYVKLEGCLIPTLIWIKSLIWSLPALVQEILVGSELTTYNYVQYS